MKALADLILVVGFEKELIVSKTHLVDHLFTKISFSLSSFRYLIIRLIPALADGTTIF